MINQIFVATLQNPVNDATDMADTLTGLGWKVMLLTDATQSDMNRALADS